MEISSKIEELRARLIHVQRQKAELEIEEGRLLGQLEIYHRNQRLLKSDIPVCGRQMETICVRKNIVDNIGSFSGGLTLSQLHEQFSHQGLQLNPSTLRSHLHRLKEKHLIQRNRR